MKIITGKEAAAIAVSIVVLGFVFGFDDGSKSFVAVNWIRNFIFVLAIVAISLLMHILVQKYFAYRHNAELEYIVWHVKRFGFRRWERLDRSPSGKALRGLPLGVMLAVVITILTNGVIYFTAIGENNILGNRMLRAGRKHIELSHYEEAIIELTGPLTNIALMVVAISIGVFFNLNVGMFVTVNFFIALFSMLPVSSLEGAKIFFGSRNLYVFGMLLIVLSYILKGVGFIGAVVLTILLACLLTGAYYFLWEYE